MIALDLPPACPERVKTILESRVADADDVIDLRRKVFGDGVVSADEAELLFTIHHRLDEESAEWRQFFIEALCDYVVQQAEPRGYVSVENAIWLIEQVMDDDIIETASELEAIIRIIETARSVPDQLIAFALMQVRFAVINGYGAAKLLEGEEAESVAGKVTSADVMLLRRILYAASGDRGAGISRDEAEILFDINDDTEGADNAPEWSELFVKAIGNAMLFACGHQVPTREDALRQDAFLQSREGVGGFLSRMARAIGRGQLGAKEDCVWEERLEAHHDEAKAAGPLTSEEAQWLIDRIGRDGAFSDNERAAICFIASESDSIDPALEPLIEKVRAA
jgi:hypothetical protein